MWSQKLQIMHLFFSSCSREIFFPLTATINSNRTVRMYSQFCKAQFFKLPLIKLLFPIIGTKESKCVYFLKIKSRHLQLCCHVFSLMCFSTKSPHAAACEAANMALGADAFSVVSHLKLSVSVRQPEVRLVNVSLLM